MQKQVFEFMGRRIELWLHAAPDHMATLIKANRMFYELDVLMKCREIYLPGTAVVDVGANIGNHSVFFGAVLGARVHAFEPYRPSFELLQMSLGKRGKSVGSRSFSRLPGLMGYDSLRLCRRHRPFRI